MNCRQPPLSLAQRKGPSVTKTQIAKPISCLEHRARRVLHRIIVTTAAMLMFPLLLQSIISRQQRAGCMAYGAALALRASHISFTFTSKIIIPVLALQYAKWDKKLSCRWQTARRLCTLMLRSPRHKTPRSTAFCIVLSRAAVWWMTAIYWPDFPTFTYPSPAWRSQWGDSLELSGSYLVRGN